MTRAQIDDAILALAVGDDRAGPFDQHVAGRFDRDARQDAAGRVLDDAGDAALRGSHGRIARDTSTKDTERQ